MERNATLQGVRGGEREGSGRNKGGGGGKGGRNDPSTVCTYEQNKN
jgi:hypothetical protein